LKFFFKKNQDWKYNFGNVLSRNYNVESIITFISNKFSQKYILEFELSQENHLWSLLTTIEPNYLVKILDKEKQVLMATNKQNNHKQHI